MSPRWRSMVNDPPTLTRRYVVAHRGGIAGHAFYAAREGDTHYPVGWAQVPEWGPSHWLDVPHPDEEAPRVYPKPIPSKKQSHSPQKRWWQWGKK